MFIFGRRLGAAVAEGGNQGVQPEGRGCGRGSQGEEATLAYVIIVIARNQQHLRQETGWSFNKVYFVIFKAYCFEQGCKSRFG